MKIERWRIDDVRPYPGNPRVNDKAVPAVANSIREFGFRNPILVDGDGVVLAGHTRLAAARSLGLADVPVVVVADLSAEQAKAFRIADNQTATLSEWDEEKLRAELAALMEADADFDADLLGFGDALEKWLSPNGAKGQTDPDAEPDAPVDPVSRPGEVYALGRHRLLCGDATDDAGAARLMAGESADLLLTDPPYAIGYTGHQTLRRSRIENDNLSPDDFVAFLTKAFRAVDPALRPDAAFYVWYADTSFLFFDAAFDAAGWRIRQGLVWVKHYLVVGRQDYHWRHEPCLYGHRAGATCRWFGAARPSSVLTFDKPSRNVGHPTKKPVELFAYQMANSCPPGGVVLDPFGGSGTSLIAAEGLGLSARLIELSPAFVDVARQRWAEYAHGEGCDWQTLTPAILS